MWPGATTATARVSPKRSSSPSAIFLVIFLGYRYPIFPPNGAYDANPMTGGEVNVIAQSLHDASGYETSMNLVSVSVALVGISAVGGLATVNITNTVGAGVNGSMLTANDEVNIDADSMHYAKPDVGGFSFSTGIAASAAMVCSPC